MPPQKCGVWHPCPHFLSRNSPTRGVCRYAIREEVSANFGRAEEDPERDWEGTVGSRSQGSDGVGLTHRHNRRTGLRFGRRWRQLGTNRARSAGGPIGRGSDLAMIRVVLPQHFRTLARVGGEITLDFTGLATIDSVLDTLEARYPMLRGAIRNHVTKHRRPFIRFFACEQDLSHESTETPLPATVVSGAEPLLIVGAMAGG